MKWPGRINRPGHWYEPSQLLYLTPLHITFANNQHPLILLAIWAIPGVIISEKIPQFSYLLPLKYLILTNHTFNGNPQLYRFFFVGHFLFLSALMQLVPHDIPYKLLLYLQPFAVLYPDFQQIIDLLFSQLRLIEIVGEKNVSTIAFPPAGNIGLLSERDTPLLLVFFGSFFSGRCFLLQA